MQLGAGTSPSAAALVGHWRKNTNAYYSVRDEHLVFHGDGTVETWAETVSGPYEGRRSRTTNTTGRWTVEGNLLKIDWGNTQTSRPFVFHDGQLVLPNIQNGRRYWNKVSSSASPRAAVAPSAPRANLNAAGTPTTSPNNLRSEVAKLGTDVDQSWREYEESAPADSVAVARKNADSGSAAAQFEMGVFNEFGFKSMKPDRRKAAEWYRKAANQGDALATEALEDLSRDPAALSEFERVKFDLRRVSRQQRMSNNVLDRMDQMAKEAIKSINSGGNN